MSYVSIISVLCEEHCVYSPLERQSRSRLTLYKSSDLGKNVCFLVFERTGKCKKSTAYQVAPGAEKQTEVLAGKQAQTVRQPCIRNDNSFGFLDKKSARQQESKGWQDGCECECECALRELQASRHKAHTLSGDFTSFIVQSLF